MWLADVEEDDRPIDPPEPDDQLTPARRRGRSPRTIPAGRVPTTARAAPRPPTPSPRPQPTAGVLPLVTVELADRLEFLRRLPSCSVQAGVTDAPYGLGDHPTPEEIVAYLTQDAHLTTGDFMGKDWSIPPIAVWRELYRVLVPGAHVAVFAGTRTWDIMSIGLRMAGFELRDTLQAPCLMWVHGCLTEDAEILTADGWKLGVDIQVGERVAAWNPSDGSIVVDSVQEKYLAPHDGPMVHLKNDDTDQLLTPEHRVYHRPRKRKMVKSVRRAWFDDAYEVVEASALTNAPVKVPLAGLHDGHGIATPGGVDGEEWAALLAWVWTEGGFDDTGTGVRIYQSQSANSANVVEIDALVGRLVPGHSRYDRERPYTHNGATRQVSETCWYFSGDLAQDVRAALPDKHPTWRMLWAMSLPEKRAFYRAAMLGDGSKATPCFHQKSDADREWFQALTTTIGYASRQCDRKPPRDGGHVSVRLSNTTQLVQRHLKGKAAHYSGRVWCVRTSTGAFVARRAGRPFITGNSGFPKSHNLSKAIDKARPERHTDALRVTAWIRDRLQITNLTAADLDAATGTQMSGHWTSAGSQPAIPTREQWAVLAPLLLPTAPSAPTTPACCADLTQVAPPRPDGHHRHCDTPTSPAPDPLDALPGWIADLVHSAHQPSENFLSRPVVGRADGQATVGPSEAGMAGFRPTYDVTLPTLPQADAAVGLGTALKPAWEPVLLFRKPLVCPDTGRPLTLAECFLRYGTGAISVDSCRVSLAGAASPSEKRRESSRRSGVVPMSGKTAAESDDEGKIGRRGDPGAFLAEHPGDSAGRWPPNLLLCHLPDCVETPDKKSVNTGVAVNRNRAPGTMTSWLSTRASQTGDDKTYASTDGTETVAAWRCASGCPVAELDAQSGESRKAPRKRATNGAVFAPDQGRLYSDTGAASRFFPTFSWEPGELDETLATHEGAAVPFLYCAKPSTAERNAGCGALDAERVAPYAGGAGMPGRTLVDGEWENTETPRKSRTNTHPTVKSRRLMRWIVRLVAPVSPLHPAPTVVDMHAGSGTTALACLDEGRACLACDNHAPYVAIAQARLTHAKQATAPGSAPAAPGPAGPARST